MRVDKGSEVMRISQVQEGLLRLELQAFQDEVEVDGRIGLLALKIGCQVYREIVFGPLPISFRAPAVKDCSLYVGAAMDLVRYFNRVKDKRKLKAAKKHLKLIGSGFFGIAASFINQQSHKSVLNNRLLELGIAQVSDNMKADASRKTIELMIGLGCMGVFDSVLLEDPYGDGTKPSNPDIIVKFKGESYGIACKSLTTRSMETFRERISEGIDQIQRSINDKNVDHNKGVIFLDISSLLDHDSLYLPAIDDGDYWSLEGVGPILTGAMNSVMRDIFGVNASSGAIELIGDLFHGKSISPCVVLYAHSLLICSAGGPLFPVYSKALHCLVAGDNSAVRIFIERLNRAIHCQ